MNTWAGTIRINAGAITAGLLTAAAFAALAAWRLEDGPWYVAFLVFFAVLSPILVVAWKVLWFDRDSYNEQFARNEQNVENAWSKDAAETGFWTIVSGSILLWGVGGALNIDWMEDIGLIHVLVLGTVGYVASYLYLQRAQK